jgi:uncharacterized protein (TIGR03437 family)
MNSLKKLWIALAPIGLWLGNIDTVRAQNTLLVSSQSLQFTVASGNISAPQAVSISTSGAAVTATLQAATSSGGSWLQLSVASVSTPGSVNVSVNAIGLAPGTYNGTITVTAPGLVGSPATINVSLTVTAAGQLNVSAPSLIFSSQAGGPSPPPSQVQVTSTAGIVNFTAQAVTFNGGSGWLLVNPLSGTTPAVIEIAVNSAGLAAGSYSGAIQLTSPAGTASVAITLNLAGTPTLQLSPPSLQIFYYQINGAVPAPQNIQMTSPGGTLSFTASTSPQGSWLVVTPASGQTPATLQVSVNVTGLTPNTYNGSIIIGTPGGSTTTTTIPVTLVVSVNPLMIPSQTSLTFNSQTSGSAPPNQQVNVTSTGSPIQFTATAATASGGSWLVVGPMTPISTPGVVTVGVNSAGLGIGTYTGTVTLTSAGATNSPLVINVTLNVAAGVQMNAVPGQLLFTYQTNQTAPAAQNVNLTSTGPPLQFTVTTATTTCGNNWLSVTSNGTTTPAALTVGVNVTGLQPGICSGTVSVASSALNGPVTIPVTLNISANAILNISPAFLSETVTQNSAQFSRTIALTSTDPNTQVQFTALASINSGSGWLLVTPNQGTTPANLTVFFLPANLAPGQYQGNIMITSPALPNAVNVPVNLTVTSNINITVNPTLLAFAQAQGGPAPAAQTVQITASSGSLGFAAAATTSAGGNWLSVTPATGNTGGAITVTANGAQLSQGTYNGQVTLSVPGAANPTVTIPVTLTVGAPQTVTAAPASLAFTFTTGGTAPANQNITVTSTGGPASVTAAASTTSGGNWLSVAPASGTTPLTLVVSATPGNLSPGTYNGSISIASPALAQPIVIGVTLTVSPRPAPAPLLILNSASNIAGPIAAGELLAIKGSLLGPAQGVNFQLNIEGRVDPILGGVRVLFDNIPGIPTFVRADQVNVFAPFEIAGRASVRVVVEYLGQQSTPIDVVVAPVAPAIFTNNFTGQGQGAILNENFTPNGAGAGFFTAAPGSVIQVFGTGDGQSNPPSFTGTVTAGRKDSIVQPTSATVGGLPATIEFSGQAPSLLAGIWQVNLRLSRNLPPGDHQVLVSFGNVTTPAGVTVRVQ